MDKILNDINSQVNFTSVFFNEIDENNKTFVFSFPERFTNPGGVDKRGIFEPVMFLKEGDRFIIIDGIKRYYAAKLYDKKFINGMFIIKTWWNNSDAFYYNIHKNKLVRDLNIIEKANIIRKVFYSDTFLEFRDKNSFLNLIEIENNETILKKYNDLCDLFDGLKIFIIKRDLPLSAAHKFTLFSPVDQKILSKLFNDYSLSTGRSKKYIEIFFDLLKKYDINLRDLFEKMNVSDIFSNEKMTDEQKLVKFEKKLINEKYPLWSESKKKVESAVKGITKNTDIHIGYDEFLESGKVCIEFDAEDLDDFRKKCKQLDKISSNPSLPDIFKSL